MALDMKIKEEIPDPTDETDDDKEPLNICFVPGKPKTEPGSDEEEDENVEHMEIEVTPAIVEFTKYNSGDDFEYVKLLHSDDEKEKKPKISVDPFSKTILDIPGGTVTFNENKRPVIKFHECNACKTTFEEIGQLKHHVSNAHGEERPYVCEHCYKCFKDTKPFKNHLAIHDEKKHVCTICGHKLYLKRNLVVHMRKHTGYKMHKCDYCDFSTPRTDHLKSHLMTHTGEKPFKCNLCSYQGTTAQGLKMHSVVHEEKSFKCHLCEYKGARKSDLAIHFRSHSDERPYKCHICDHQAKTPKNLKMHILTHSSEKPYSCVLCDFKGRTPTSLRFHMRVHTNYKPYQCTECEYKCATSGGLRIHMRIHTKERPYKCDICPYAAITKVSLRIHYRTHTGEKPYSCEICQRNFTQKGTLKFHNSKFHPELS